MSRRKVFSRRKYGGELGFTLVETIVTLAILAVLLGIVLSAMRIGIRSWEKGEAVIENASAKRMLASKFFREISSVYPYPDGEDTEGVLFSGGQNSLGFVTVAGAGYPGLPWGGAKWVYYSVRDGKLTVREKTVPGENVQTDEGGRLVELDSGVKELLFEYLGKDGWAGSWNAGGKAGLPAAIKVKVSFTDGRKAFVESVPVGLTHDRKRKPDV